MGKKSRLERTQERTAGRTNPLEIQRFTRLGYAVDRINFMRCSYGSEEN